MIELKVFRFLTVILWKFNQIMAKLVNLVEKLKVVSIHLIELKKRKMTNLNLIVQVPRKSFNQVLLIKMSVNLVFKNWDKLQWQAVTLASIQFITMKTSLKNSSTITKFMKSFSKNRTSKKVLESLQISITSIQNFHYKS